MLNNQRVETVIPQFPTKNRVLPWPVYVFFFMCLLGAKAGFLNGILSMSRHQTTQDTQSTNHILICSYNIYIYYTYIYIICIHIHTHNYCTLIWIVVSDHWRINISWNLMQILSNSIYTITINYITIVTMVSNPWKIANSLGGSSSRAWGTERKSNHQPVVCLDGIDRPIRAKSCQVVLDVMICKGLKYFLSM